MASRIAASLLLALMLSAAACAADHIVVGSKVFTEGYVLGEIAAQTIEANSTVPVERKLGMGNTGILFEALSSGAIDVYSDYTGTLSEAILKQPNLKSIPDIQAALAKMGLVMSDTLGFNDTYALAVKESFAEKYQLQAISDLAKIQSDISGGFCLRIHGSPGRVSGIDPALSFALRPAARQAHGAQPLVSSHR